MVTNFLEDLKRRNGVHQVTNWETASKALDNPSSAFIGFDPTADSLHVGSLVQIILLARLGLAGHNPIALIGGATGMIGDPSGKSKERALQDSETIKKNADSIQRQADAILRRVFSDGKSPVTWANNADWLSGMHVIDFLRDVGKHFSVNAMLQRESVKSRLETRDQGVSFTEFSYMLLQSADFLHLWEKHDCIAQIGGSDQWGNIVSGIDLINKKHPDSDAFGITVPLLVQKNGQKFGKTEAGTIWLDAAKTSPFAFHQFWLNLEDDDACQVFRMLSLRDFDEVCSLEQKAKIDPSARLVHHALADEMTSLVHGPEVLAAVKKAEKVLFGHFPVGSIDEATCEMLCREIPSFEGGYGLFGLLVGLNRPFDSIGNAKRALKEGSVFINGAPAEGWHVNRTLLHGKFALIKHGKRFFMASFPRPY